MKKYEYKDVAGSFRHGIKIPKWFWIVFISLIAFWLIAYIATLTGILCTVERISSEEVIIFCGGAGVGLFLIAVLAGYYFYYCVYAKKQISSWLDDDLIEEITVSPWKFSSNGVGFFKTISLGVRFNYNGNSFTVISKKYDKKFLQCLNKQITILYSPKYDEVIIIKYD